MTSIRIRLPDDVKAKAERRAAEAGHETVEAYVEALVRADTTAADSPGAASAAPDHLTFRTDEELEARLLERLDDSAGVEATPAFWDDLKRKARQPAPRPEGR